MTHRVCEFPDCGRKHESRGYCKAHARQLRVHGRTYPLSSASRGNHPVRCVGPECDRYTCRLNGMCDTHNDQRRRGSDLTVIGSTVGKTSGRSFIIDRTGRKYGALTVVGGPNYIGKELTWLCTCSCGRSVTVRSCLINRRQSCGSCRPHRRKGTDHNTPKEKIVTTSGYFKVKAEGHPRADRGNRVFEHIIVMESLLGRLLVPGENVHHLNGVRLDNTVDGPLQLHEGRWRSGNLELWNTSQPAGQRVEDKVKWAKELLALYEPESLAAGVDRLPETEKEAA